MDYASKIQHLAYSNYRSEPATPKQLKTIAILLGDVTHSRDVRLQLLSSIFNRTFTTSKELSKSEAKALIEVGFYLDWTPIPAFLEYLMGLTMDVVF